MITKGEISKIFAASCHMSHSTCSLLHSLEITMSVGFNGRAFFYQLLILLTPQKRAVLVASPSTTIIPRAPLASRLNRKTPVHTKRLRGFSEKLQAYMYLFVKRLVNPLQHGILRNRSCTTQFHRPEPGQKHFPEEFDSVDN